MWQQVGRVAVVIGFLTGAAAGAYAQGSVTQDPGQLTPGNLTSQRLGPSSDFPGTAGTGPTSGRGTSTFRGPTAPGYGTNSGDWGAGNGPGFGGYPAGGALSRGVGPGR
jgi:hypothetical protein